MPQKRSDSNADNSTSETETQSAAESQPELDEAEGGEIDDDTAILEPDEEFSPAPNRFNITSYGWDSDVEGLVKRLERGDIHVPGFQRGFIWASKDKSRFIESLVLGLPVPNIFLAQDSKTKSLNIVDGQQRLRTLQDYINGEFYLSASAVQEDLKGRYYSTEVAKSKSSKVLEPSDARALADSVLHSIVIKPDPIHDDADRGHEYNEAIIQIFRRLNTTGKPLNDQEIRTSIFYGSFDNMLRDLNTDESWRTLFGKTHSRLKDVELILRFVALREAGSEYKSPMPRFLTNFMEHNRDMPEAEIMAITEAFKRVVSVLLKVYGRTVLRSGSTLIVSKLDATMIGLDKYLSSHDDIDENDLKARLIELDNDPDYLWSIDEFVNDTDRVSVRIKRAQAIIGA